MSLGDEVTRAIPAKTKLSKIAELLERSGIDIEDVGKVDKVRIGEYQVVTKNKVMDEKTGKEVEVTEVHDLRADSLVLTPTWETGPQWPVIQPGPPVKMPPRKSSAKKVDDSEWGVAVVLPDIQGGYYRGLDGELVPTHDEEALELALAIVKDAKPDTIVLVGDNLDFCELGKYRHSPAFQATTQATLDRFTLFLAQLRSSAPDSRIVWIEGNHEARLPNYVLDNARAAFGLRRGSLPNERPADWPLVSVPELLRMDEFDVEYLAGYPASTFWITPRLKVIHGDLVRSGGSTAHAYLGREKTSILYGHIHRIERAHRTRDDHDGPREVMAASPGCLARTDGVVPSTKGGIDLDGRPINRSEDWQQGLAVVPYNKTNGNFVYEQVAIHPHDDGGKWAHWRGKEYIARD